MTHWLLLLAAWTVLTVPLAMLVGRYLQRGQGPSPEEPLPRRRRR